MKRKTGSYVKSTQVCVCQICLSSVKYCSYMSLDVCLYFRSLILFGIVKGKKKHLSLLIYMNACIAGKKCCKSFIWLGQFQSLSVFVGSPETKCCYFSCFSLVSGK